MAGKGREDFASSSLVALVVRSIAATDPDLLPPGAQAPDPMKDATLSAAEKRRLLVHVYDRRGAGPLLAVGRYLESTTSPVLSVLSNAAQPDMLIDKWQRLERYSHAVNRTDMFFESANALFCHRYAERGVPPTAAENALIAGFLVGTCGLAGARGIRLDIDGQTFEASDLRSAGPVRQGGATFRITWEKWKPPLLPQSQQGAVLTGERLKMLIAGDVARSWSLDEIARLMAKSVRSLQRELSVEGVTFSTALRGARIVEAARLLREDGASLAEIGYCCGYADQPHFQRDFRRALNMSPGDYRRIALS